MKMWIMIANQVAAYQTYSLAPVNGTSMYKTVGKLLGALHISLACRAIRKYISNEKVILFCLMVCTFIDHTGLIN